MSFSGSIGYLLSIQTLWLEKIDFFENGKNDAVFRSFMSNRVFIWRLIQS